MGKSDPRTNADRQPPEKRSFDKKAYRLKKYSIKYKLDKWEEKRRKSILKKYFKDVKSDPSYGKYKPFNYDQIEKFGSSGDEKEPSEEIAKPVTDEKDERLHYVMHPNLMEQFKKEEKPFWKAMMELERLREEKQALKAAADKARRERAEALEMYKLKKTEIFKKLSKKTKKGQPVMKDRMQMLLENIQNSLKL